MSVQNKQLIQTRALKDIVETDAVKSRLKEIMGARAPQFAAALVQIVNQSWQLQKCEPNSVIGAALTAAALDLSIDPNLGEAHIVPYGTKATFQIGYIGFNQLAMRSGQYKRLGWKVVHKGELEVWDELSGELVINAKYPDEEVIGYAAKFTLLNGFERGIYWTVEECFDHAERFSQAYRYGKDHPDKRDSVWWKNPDRACLKTVIKMLIKLWGPKSIQMQKALKMDEAAVVDVDGDPEYVDNPAEVQQTEPVFDAAPEPPPAEQKPETKKEAPKPEKPRATAPKAHGTAVKLEPKPAANPPAKPAPAPEPAPQQESFESAAPAGAGTEVNLVRYITGMCQVDNIAEEQLFDFLRGINVVDDTVNTIAAIPQDVQQLVKEQWADIVQRIKDSQKN